MLRRELSSRDLALLACCFAGMRYAETARAMGISSSYVKYLMMLLRLRLGAKNNPHLARIAVARRLPVPPFSALG